MAEFPFEKWPMALRQAAEDASPGGIVTFAERRMLAAVASLLIAEGRRQASADVRAYMRSVADADDNVAWRMCAISVLDNVAALVERTTDGE